jgi:hypothetical protein
MLNEIDELRAELDKATASADFYKQKYSAVFDELAALKQQEPAAWMDKDGCPCTKQEKDSLMSWTEEYTVPLFLAAGAQPVPEPAHIKMAPDCLNTNDKAFWVIGWNECRIAMLEAAKEKP